MTNMTRQCSEVIWKRC